MIIDVNAYLGHFAFRQLRHNTAASLLALMDNRQRSWLVNVPDVPLDELAALVKACPQARFVLLNGLGYAKSALGRKDNGLPANYLIEISRLSALLDNEIGQLIAGLGAERLVLGTGMPFSYPDPVLLKLDVLSASQEDKAKIGWKNIAQWLRL
jgi:hypothetical protein